METKAGEFKKTQKPIPPTGQHLGLLYSIVDLGTQLGSFEGKPTKARKIQLTFELPKFKAVFNEANGEQVMVVGHDYTFSLNEKAGFRKMMDSWFEKPVLELNHDILVKLLKRPAMLQIIHIKDKKDTSITYANIALKGQSVFKRPAEVPFPKDTENDAFVFSLGDLEKLDRFSWETFNKIPQWIQKKIEKCEEWPRVLAKYGVNPKTKAGATAGTVTEEIGQFDDGQDDPF